MRRQQAWGGEQAWRAGCRRRLRTEVLLPVSPGLWQGQLHVCDAWSRHGLRGTLFKKKDIFLKSYFGTF